MFWGGRRGGRALLIFDILHSGGGDTLLQINVIGPMGPQHPTHLIDFLATEGHIRWMQKGNETLPSGDKNWIGDLSDFAIPYPIIGPNEIFESEKCSTGPTPGFCVASVAAKRRDLPHPLLPTRLKSWTDRLRALSFSRIRERVGTLALQKHISTLLILLPQ